MLIKGILALEGPVQLMIRLIVKTPTSVHS